MARATIHENEVQVDAAGVPLAGTLSIPEGAAALVLFAHGSGSSRFSSRNRFVAEQLHDGGLATLLFDLLTREEGEIDERTMHLRFDIPLLAARLIGAADWCGSEAEIRNMKLGAFGASTGAAAAIIAAAKRPSAVGAVVSRGGRPDLADDALPDVLAPTLLIVGSKNTPVIRMNRHAAARLRCEHRLELVPGASHLFEEPGTLEEVARLSRDWFKEHLR